MSTTLKTHMVRLTDDELAVLDGKCRPEIQAEVDRALARRSMAAALNHLPAALAGLVADIVNMAWSEGRLRSGGCSIQWCSYCGARGGYAKYKRSGRFHLAGDENTDKPLTIGGTAFSSGSGPAIECCHTCFAAIRTSLAEVLSEVRAEIPEHILGQPSRFVWRQKMRCATCNWTGHEGEVRRQRWEDATCPKCGARSRVTAEPGGVVTGPPEEMAAQLMAEAPTANVRATGGGR